MTYMIDVIPGIYEDSAEELARKVDLVAGTVTWVQIDISDGTLVEKISVTDMSKLKTIICNHPNLSFEAHLMVAYPEKIVRELVDAGFKRLIAHVESNDPRAFLDIAQYESVEVGIAIDAPTDFDQLEPFLDELDMVLVMTVEAGASGQPFLPETLEKIKTLHENLPDMPIEVDGGMNPDTAKLVREMGATKVVTTAFVFKHDTGIADRVAQLSGV